MALCRHLSSYPLTHTQPPRDGRGGGVEKKDRIPYRLGVLLVTQNRNFNAEEGTPGSQNFHLRPGFPHIYCPWLGFFLYGPSDIPGAAIEMNKLNQKVTKLAYCGMP